MNIWDHPATIAAEALRHLEDQLVIAPLCAKDNTSEFTNKSNGWKKGDTVSFRTHGEYVVNEFTEGGTITTQPISTSTRAMKIEKHLDVSVEVTAREEVMDLDSFSDQVIRPGTYKLAEKIDTYLGGKILEGAGLYTSAVLLSTIEDVAQARKAATIQQLVMDRFCLVDLDTEATLLGQAWFNQSQIRGADAELALRNATMNHVMGMDWYASIAFPTSTHTAGTGTAVTDNATTPGDNQIGKKVLTIDNTGVGALNAGDRIIVAGLRRPLIVATAVADVSVVLAIDLVDPITEIVPDNAAVSVVSSGDTYTHRGAIFDDKALAVAFPMLDMPGDRVTGVASNNGISIRIVKGYDLTYKKTTMSMDLLVGAFALDPRRITLLGSV